MNTLAFINSAQLLTRLNLAVLLMGVFTCVALLPCCAAEQGKTAASVDDDEDSGDWMFDDSTYTNDPKTGHRVDQYKKEKTPYRDPNAWFDSPMGGFPFLYGSFGEFSDYMPFYYYGFWPELYSNYYFGEDGSGYYPYDGDPNEEEDDNRK